VSWRTVIVSRHAKLDLQVGFLNVRSDDGTRRVVLDEIDILLIESTAVSLTAALLAELVSRKVKVIFCDRSRNPIAELTPYHGCRDSSRRLRQQLGWSVETKAEIWRRIVQEKILNQANVLQQFGKLDAAASLKGYARSVEIGDCTNREGQSARRYFVALFGEDFTRDRQCDVNSALDYGYQVLLSVFARELAVEGYVTELGIFHDNGGNPFNLASDLIEPYRPFVDRLVKEWFRDEHNKFDVEARRRLVLLLHDEVEVGGLRTSLINAAISTTRSVTDALSSDNLDGLRFPTR